MTEKSCRFGHNVRNYRLVKTVTASFNSTMGQTAETTQRKKTVFH